MNTLAFLYGTSKEPGEAADHSASGCARNGSGRSSRFYCQHRQGRKSGGRYPLYIFPSKNDLFNEVYIEIKNEVYRRLHDSFPHGAELYERVKHVWTKTLHLAIEEPEERKVSLQLHLSSSLTDATRKLVGSRSGVVAQTMSELAGRGIFRELPSGFAAAAMGAMQDAVVESIAKKPCLKSVLMEKGFAAFWRMAE